MSRGADILIVDDDRPIADFIAEALQDEGYVPRVAYTVAAALQALREALPSLIVLDLNVPTAQHGATFLDHWRNSEARAIPLIVVTALSKAPSAAQLGVTELLPKPFELRDLLALVERYL